MKRLLTILLLALAVLPARSKDRADDGVILQNVEVSRQKTVFTITYDISLGAGLRSCSVSLLLSTDAGATFSAVDKKNLSGDFGRVGSSGTKTIQYDFAQDKESLAGRELAFKVEVTDKETLDNDILATAQVAVYPHLSYGLMFGMVRTWGWYAKLRSDFRFPSAAYDFSTADGRFWGNGNSQISRFNVTAGAMVRAVKWLYPYLGLGYGSYGLYWQDSAGQWARISDYSTRGLSIDAGVAFRFGKVAVTVGASNTMFRYTEAEVGVGIMF